MQTPPHDVEVEKAVLSSLIMGNPHDSAILLPRLTPDHFLHPSHRLLFVAVQSLLATGMPTDALSIWQELGRTGRQDRMDFPAIVELIRTAEDSIRPDTQIEILRELHHRRQLIHLASRLSSQAFDTTCEPEEIIHAAQKGLHDVALDQGTDDGEGWEEILHAMASHEKFKKSGPDSMGWWGIPTLDCVAPIPSGEYVTVGARPGVGKTALMTQIAVESAGKGLKTLVVTLELSRVSMRARLASYMAKRPVAALKRGDYDAGDVVELGTHPTALANGRIQSPSPGTPWAKLDAMIRYEVDRYGIQLILLDQFDKIGRPAVGRGSSEAYAFGQVSTGIMALAKDLDIGFILLCQLKGDAEGREPTLADHADSDRPGKDAAVVVHLWRDKDNNVKAKIQKNRDGAFVGKRISLDFKGDRQKFVELEEVQHETNGSGWAKV